MSTGNKAIVERFYQEVVNQGNLALAGELMAHDYIEHGNPAASGLEGFKQFVANLAGPFRTCRSPSRT
jgi:predicted SnoaL-like aldol condensation-catalyzing enzyme